MNEPEAFQLLTLASARDNRTVSASVAKVWADDLEHVELGEAVEALKLHYQEQPDKWLISGHVITGVRRVRERRAREERIAGQREIAPNVITLDRAEFERMTAEATEAARKARGD